MNNIEFEKAGNFPLKGLNVPTYRVGRNPSLCVRDSDLPDALAAAFSCASAGSTCPAPGAAYLYDFEAFMTSNDPVAKRYSGRMELEKVDVLEYRNLKVFVWRVEEPEKYNMYAGPFVRDEDLPEDLRKAFNEWQMLAACPGRGMSYLHDFTGFMECSGRGWSGDFSAVVKRYK